MDRYLSPLAQEQLRAAIAEAGGNEVFALGRNAGEERCVSSVEVLARGHARAVPAILQLCRPGDAVIHNHPSGSLTPSDADLEIAWGAGMEVAETYTRIIGRAVIRILIPGEFVWNKEWLVKLLAV